jgi:site-specific DNA-adenine methylase
MTKPFQTYPGGKASPGVTQILINLIPADIICYISPTLGNDPVFRAIKPFKVASLIDIDPGVVDRWKAFAASCPKTKWEKSFVNIYNEDCFTVLSDFEIDGFAWGITPSKVLIFLDPPYLMDTRSTKQRIYKYEFTDDMHRKLLSRVRALSNRGYNIMICCYPNEMYDAELGPFGGWVYEDYKSQTRAGQVTERVYFNYPKPTDLHDFSFYGANFRQREQIKRKKNSLVKKLMELPENIRQYAINETIATLKSLNP